MAQENTISVSFTEAEVTQLKTQLQILQACYKAKQKALPQAKDKLSVG